MMESLAAVAVVLPLLGAAAVMAAGPLVGWRVRDAVGIMVAGGTVALTAWLATAPEVVVSWLGGWEPVGGRAIGIALAVDPFGAGIALLAAVLTTMSLVFTWRYFETVGVLFHALMLMFLGGMVGFGLSGDLFNLFVFFELLTTAAYALTAYQVEREAPLQGSLNFAVTNTLGAFLLLYGIGMLYSRTGSLNLAAVGADLAGSGPDLVLVASFVLLSAGLFVKAAIVPFHFWLADAHSVAPTPVSVLLSGVMIELGLYGWVRIYWNVFAGPFHGDESGLRILLVALGAATALIAGVFALVQDHLKRLLAYSSVSHSGLILMGVALLDPGGLAGASLYVLGHGGIKGALFLLAGILLHRHGTVDQSELYGRGRGDRVIGFLFVLAGLALAGMPPFGTALGKQLVEEAARLQGLGWAVTGVFVGAGGATAGAVLAAAGRIFGGWGPVEPAGRELGEDEGEEQETTGGAATRPTPLVMLLPVVALLVGALAVGLVPDVAQAAKATAALVVRPAEYRAAVMEGAAVSLPGAEPARLSVRGAAAGAAGALLALVFAGLALGRRRLRVPDRLREPVESAVDAVRRLQSGHVGDYVAWMVFGAGALAGTVLLVTHL